MRSEGTEDNSASWSSLAMTAREGKGRKGTQGCRSYQGKRKGKEVVGEKSVVAVRGER